MKTPLIISVCLLLCLFACRKDAAIMEHADLQAIPTTPIVPLPVVVDYRDTVLGTYIGTAHLVRKVQMCTNVILDTTFTDTIAVTNFTSPTVIYLNGLWANLRTNYSIGDDEGHYAHGGIGGNFTFTSQATNLTFSSGDSWNGVCNTYEFTGAKQ